MVKTSELENLSQTPELQIEQEGVTKAAIPPEKSGGPIEATQATTLSGYGITFRLRNQAAPLKQGAGGDGSLV